MSSKQMNSAATGPPASRDAPEGSARPAAGRTRLRRGQHAVAAIVLIGLATGVTFAVAGTRAGAAARRATARAQTTSPSDLLSSAAAAVKRQRGVVESASEAEGSDSATFSLHVGANEGEETIHFVEGKNHGTATISELDSHLYLKADQFGLTTTSFTADAAKREANRWIEVPLSSTYGKQLAGGLTISAAAQELHLTGSLSLTKPTTVNGQRVVGVTETENGATLTVYLRDGSTPLPVEVTLKASVDEQISFSDWGSVPQLSKPAHTVAFQTSWVKTS